MKKKLLISIATLVVLAFGASYLLATDAADLQFRFGITATPAEINVLDGITATVSELNIMDGVTATEAEIDRACDVSARIVTLTADTTIAPATHEGKLLLMGEVGGDAQATFTLPAATGSGVIYRFVVSVVNTSNYIIAAAGTDTMSGVIITTQDAADTTLGWEVDGTDDKLTLNGTTTGGVTIGDWIECIDILSAVWAVKGQTTSSGTEATPASAS